MRRSILLSPQKRKIRNIRKQRRRLHLPLSLVEAKSTRELFITLRATGASQHCHLFMVLFLLPSTDLGSTFILGLLPSLQHHASQMPQAFILPLHRTTIILVIIVVNPNISPRNAPTLNSITPISKGRLPAILNRASLRMWLKKVKMHRGETSEKSWTSFSHGGWNHTRRRADDDGYVLLLIILL